MRKIKHIIIGLLSCYKLHLPSLSLMRIALAIVILLDLIFRCSDIEAFYTAQGIWPKTVVYNFAWSRGYWSFHLIFDTYLWNGILFGFHFLLALSLLLGYRTQLVTALLWLFTVSLHNRNLFILQSGDDLLRLTLLWAIFLPWGQYYSLDARQHRKGFYLTRLASMGYLILIASVYTFTVLLKNSNEWRVDGTAIYYALSLEQIRLPITGDFVYQFPSLMRALTYVVYGIECLIPILLLWPSKCKWLRRSAFMCLLFLHVGIALTLYVGLFPFICMAVSIGFLPKANKLENFMNKIFAEPLPLRRTKPFHPFFTKAWQYMLGFVICICLFINLEQLQFFNYQLRDEIYFFGNALRLNQNWGMFSPDVLKKDGWLVYHGADSLGRQWDLRRNDDYVDYTKPKHIVSQYKNDRWRKLAENMQNDNFTFLRPKYCRYILNHWKKQHPEKKMELLNLYFMEKENLPDYKTTTVKKSLYCICNYD